jgi:hypothetical protein
VGLGIGGTLFMRYNDLMPDNYSKSIELETET